MRRQKQQPLSKFLIPAIIIIVIGIIVSIPRIYLWEYNHSTIDYNTHPEFPVSVDPATKTITEDENINAFLADKHSLHGASVFDALHSFIGKIAISINNAPWYQTTASTGGKFVTIPSGLRKEQVANMFGTHLKWNSAQRKIFITPSKIGGLPFFEGSFAPGTYFISPGMTPEEVQALVNQRFTNEVLSHYGTSTQEMVPLEDALIIASLIQRETIGTDGMRLISGIMWNRLFSNMKLQVDATLQYSKANSTTGGTWWPNVVPNDKYIRSAYNTYQHTGLPPTPIANPSVAAILAALNPIQTPCFFYFNDPKGNFHCSVTYEEHVKSLKLYY